MVERRHAIGSSYETSNVSENGIYLGIPLLLAAILLFALRSSTNTDRTEAVHLV